MISQINHFIHLFLLDSNHLIRIVINFFVFLCFFNKIIYNIMLKVEESSAYANFTIEKGMCGD